MWVSLLSDDCPLVAACGLLPWKPEISVFILLTSAGSSPNDSYVRPQRISRATQMHGAKPHCGPVARVSAAVTAPSCWVSDGSRVDPLPMSCGKMVAPAMLLSP